MTNLSNPGLNMGFFQTRTTLTDTHKKLETLRKLVDFRSREKVYIESEFGTSFKARVGERKGEKRSG